MVIWLLEFIIFFEIIWKDFHRNQDFEFSNILGADKIFECQNFTSKELRFELLKQGWCLLNLEV